MIAVLASDAERAAVKEFFELFKTPWEYYRPDSEYDVLICCDTELPDSSAKLILIYAAEQQSFDQRNGIKISSRCSNGFVVGNGERIPIYGKCVTFAGGGVPALLEERTKEAAALLIASNGETFVRIGFNLFQEVRYSLTRGQPVENAAIPTLELHIAFLRDLITSYSFFLVEIPPLPVGYPFIVCLTHDVDHVAVRNHKWDHTMFGFLYRAVIGSLVDLCRGKKKIKHVASNWVAALSLPLVHFGLAKDFWDQFDRYLEMEEGLTSTFFVIPTKGDPGKDANGFAPSKRAAAYEVSEIAEPLSRLLQEHREIGLHGIDAWRDREKGRAELDRIRCVTGASEVGVRIHWLFFNEKSPAILEQAGFTYDSTVGYNETVGYRAGTVQAFKSLDVERILELPLHIMDTALFFPVYMNLSSEEANEVVDLLVENALRFGGTLTVNWHDRSIAPERLWDQTYVRLLEDLKQKGAWFPTAMQAVSWFRKRRSAVIESATREGGNLRVKISLSEGGDNLPGLRLRVHKARKRQTNGPLSAEPEGGFADFSFNHSDEMLVEL